MVIVHDASETLYACVETLTEPPKVEKNGAKCSASVSYTHLTLPTNREV